MAASALAGAVLVGVLPNAPASAEPAPDLCAYEAVRGPVAPDFAIEACVDGSSVFLRNDLDFTVVAEAHGTQEPVALRRADGPRSTLVRLVVDADVLLLPGDVVQLPLTDGPARVVLSTAEPRAAAAMADSVREFLPDTASGPASAQAYRTVAALVRELAPAVERRADCVEDRNWLQVAACDVDTAWTVSHTVTGQLEENWSKAVLPVALDRESWERWARGRSPDLDGAGDRSVVLTQEARSGREGAPPPRAYGPWRPVATIGDQVRRGGGVISQHPRPSSTAHRPPGAPPAVPGPPSELRPQPRPEPPSEPRPQPRPEPPSEPRPQPPSDPRPQPRPASDRGPQAGTKPQSAPAQEGNPPTQKPPPQEDSFPEEQAARAKEGSSKDNGPSEDRGSNATGPDKVKGPEKAKGLGKPKGPEKAKGLGKPEGPEKAKGLGKPEGPEKAKGPGKPKGPEKARGPEKRKSSGGGGGRGRG